MRPKSIVLFEVFLVAGLAVASLKKLYGIADTARAFGQLPGAAELGSPTNLAYAALIIGLAPYLVVWFFIARQARNWAKWIYVALTLLGVAMNIPIVVELDAYSNAQIAIVSAICASQVAATAMLFRPTAREWFAGKGPVDPRVFS